MNMSTTNDGRFRVEDVTHTPKRTQSGNIAVACSDVESDCSDGKILAYQKPQTFGSVYPPESLTIESAISFYEKNADGPFKGLYTMTAKWLRSIISVKSRADASDEVVK